MFRRNAVLAMSLWEGPQMEHLNWGRLWARMSGGRQGLTVRKVPRNLHGYVEELHPRTDEVLRWYPYKNELTVDGKAKPTFMDILNTHYFPKPMDDAERCKYVAEKYGRDEEEVASEMFRMRRLKMGVAQSVRMKLKGRGFRQPTGVWEGIDRDYMIASAGAAQALGMAFYNNNSFEPTIIWSKHFQFGDCIDLMLNKPLRTSLQYCLGEVVVHRTIPRSRLPGIKGSCKYPLEDLEPCLYDALKLKLAVMAYIAKKEAYVVDTMVDGGHRYLGCIMHITQVPHCPEKSVVHELEAVDLDLDLAERWLFHYNETVLGAGKIGTLKPQGGSLNGQDGDTRMA